MYKIQSINKEILPKELATGSTDYSCTLKKKKKKKKKMLGPFSPQKTASIAFTDHCTWNFFFTGKSVHFYSMDSFQLRLVVASSCLTHS